MNKQVRKYQVIAAIKQYNEKVGNEHYVPHTLERQHDISGAFRWTVRYERGNGYDTAFIGDTLREALEHIEWNIDMVDYR
jgi:hypothetical protein